MNVPYSSDKRVEGELGLNSCGAQTIAERDCQVRRKRLDYTVMYIAKGRAVLYRGAKKIEVGEGEALFFPPDVPQRYAFFKSDVSVNKWVHFGGTLASPLEPGGARKITVANRREFENVLDGLVRAYNGIGELRGELTAGYLRVLVALLRESESKVENGKPNASRRLSEALNYIHVNAYSEIDLDRAAAICYISRDRFNHVFKEATGFPPNVYLTKLRVERAKQLLRDEGMSVRECAESVGFDDPNYFCRVFKKEVGASPKKYALGKG